MTVIAGAVSRDGSRLPRWLRKSLVVNVSRDPADVPEVFEGDEWLLAKVDIGAFGSKGSLDAASHAALIVAGEPLISGTSISGDRNRQGEVEAIFTELCDGRVAALQSATGVFCGAFYTPREHRLTLFSDKLGVRPIYYIVTPEFAAFTSALRVFEAAGLTSGGIDVRGTYDLCAFGFPLGTRTCYEGIRTIGPAELVHIDRAAETHEFYFRWDRLEPGDCIEAELLHRLADMFDDGIRRRLRGDKVTLSFLSGGLDSRSIVATLRKHNVKTLTANFAPPGTQDRAFASLAAEALGVEHHQLNVPLSAAADVYRQKELKHWIRSLRPPTPIPERPHCIWSGDGGSVGMGHVYLDEESVEAFERGDVDAGIRGFLRYNRLPGASNSAMTPAFRVRSRSWHIDGVREEIASLDRGANGRALYLFLMRNDQRRHLAKHFENIDLNRFEFHLPFFDSHFLETIVRAPIRPFLRHALYHKWLVVLSPAATSVPWQTYPNHERCPIASDDRLRYQWGDYFGKAEDRRLARKQGREALSRFFNRCFPDDLINRARYAPAIILSLMGFNAFGHVVRVGDTFVRCWQQTRVARSGAVAERSVEKSSGKT